MDYIKIYEALIGKAKNDNRKRLKRTHPNYTYYESHHILPKCLGGNNDKNNLVLLTAREHYVCHKLLVKIYPNNRKLVCAFNWMSNNKQFKQYVSSKDYEYSKELMHNTPVSIETRKKQSEAKKGDKNPNNGGLSKEHIEKIRKSNIGGKHTDETIQKLKKIQSKPRPNRIKEYIITSPTGVIYKIETRKELYKFISLHSLSQRKLIANINNGIITKDNFKFLTKSSMPTLGWRIDSKMKEK